MASRQKMYRVVQWPERWQVVHEDDEHLRITREQAQACADLLNEMARRPEAKEITVRVPRKRRAR